jgi:hypothetical protein
MCAQSCESRGRCIKASNLFTFDFLHAHRLIANITRCFFWLGNRFEFALLLQSILMILAQVRFVCAALASRRSGTDDFKRPACTPVHLHTIQTSYKHRDSRLFDSSVVVLAMAKLQPVHRVFGRIHVSPRLSGTSSIEFC